MTTGRRRRPGEGGPGGSADVVSFAAWADYRHRASARVAGAREALGMTQAEFADHLAGLLGWRVAPATVGNWEGGSNPPGDVIEASIAIGGGAVAAAALLDSVPNSLPAGALAGPWVTAYQFTHRGRPHYHADVAHVTADSDRMVRAVNHPPDPRTQGRAVPFRNEIEARLYGRHLIGAWRNMSDTRYFGSLHLAVLPGETVMDGTYTGLASDIEVSAERWRWARLEPGDLTGAVLREPSAIYELVMTRDQDDPPLTAADIRED
jgi:hypothetical protein